MRWRPHTSAAGEATFDPAELVRLTRDAMAQAAGKHAVEATMVAAFWHSLMGVDARGKPNTPVFTWADTRASAAAEQLRAELDEPAVHDRNGCRLHSSYWPAKLRWLAQAEPEAFQRTKRWLSFPEYLEWQLTGELACSVSMASGTGLLDRRSCEWDESLLEHLNLEPAQLAPLKDAGAAVGDGAAANLGSDCTGPERIALTVGTSSAMRMVVDHVPERLPRSLWCYRLSRERPIIGGALSEGGNVWAWLKATLSLPKNTEQELASMEPDTHGLTILPFIAGERSPGWMPNARLTIDGLSASTTPIHIARAALEAIAYRLYAVHQALKAPDADVIASGSAILSSPAWLQIVADVLGTTVRPLIDPEATLRGAALLALDSLGLDNHAPAKLGRPYDPNPAHHARYQQAIERQRASTHACSVQTLQ